MFKINLPRMPFMAAPKDSGSNPIWLDSCEMSEAFDMLDTFLDDGGGAKWEDLFLDVFRLLLLAGLRPS